MRLGSLLLILGAFGLSLQLLDRFPLREDEALYSYWALHARHEDFLMLQVWPDKPPLFIWALAGVFELLGTSQATARILNIFATTLTVPIMAVIASQLWGKPASLLAAALYALNPFAISFAATAYTDPLLVFFGQLALYHAIAGQGLRSGFWLGAAIITKQQGLFYLPFVFVALLWQRHLQQGSHARWYSTTTLKFCMGMALIIVPIVYWDSLRWDVAPSPWDLSVRNYGGLALVPATKWWGRLQAWGGLLWYFGATSLVWFGYLGLITVGIGLFFRAKTSLQPTSAIRGDYGSIKNNLWLLLFVGWSGAFLTIHTITTMQIWDRYLLPLVPIAVLTVVGITFANHNRWRAEIISRPQALRTAPNGFPQIRPVIWQSPKSERCALLITSFVVLLMLPTAWRAAQGHFPVGGDRGAYTGLVEAVEWLHTQSGSFVLYHQRLGWQLRFYLYNAPNIDLDFEDAAETTSELRWFANAVTLADDAAKTPYRKRFYLHPKWNPIRNVSLHLATRRMQLQEQASFHQMTLHEIRNRPQLPCHWCYCHSPNPLPWFAIPNNR